MEFAFLHSLRNNVINDSLRRKAEGEYGTEYSELTTSRLCLMADILNWRYCAENKVYIFEFPQEPPTLSFIGCAALVHAVFGQHIFDYSSTRACDALSIRKGPGRNIKLSCDGPCQCDYGDNAFLMKVKNTF